MNTTGSWICWNKRTGWRVKTCESTAGLCYLSFSPGTAIFKQQHAGPMWVRKSKGNVFIGNLPPSFTDEQLVEIFDPFGMVLSAAVARDPETGAKLRYGFVDIATERAAANAIRSLDGTEIDGCKLKVKPSQKPTPLVKASGVNGAHHEQKPRRLRGAS